MKSCTVTGCLVIALFVALGGAVAPAGWGYWRAAGFTAAYLAACWFCGGIYIAAILHAGVAHRAADFDDLFVALFVLFQNTLIVPIDPVAWVARHRYHHAHPDTALDPNRRPGDGFRRTLRLAVVPHPHGPVACDDPVLRSRAFRLVAHPAFAFAAQFSTYGVLWLATRSWPFALYLWIGVRCFGVYVNLIQNYWCHDRRFGSRRYETPDDSVNLSERLPAILSFGNTFHNNHHRHPRLLRLSHAPGEFDFGFAVLRLLKACGLVRGTRAGLRRPSDLPLEEIGF